MGENYRYVHIPNMGLHRLNQSVVAVAPQIARRLLQSSNSTIIEIIWMMQELVVKNEITLHIEKKKIQVIFYDDQWCF